MRTTAVYLQCSSVIQRSVNLQVQGPNRMADGKTYPAVCSKIAVQGISFFSSQITG